MNQKAKPEQNENTYDYELIRSNIRDALNRGKKLHEIDIEKVIANIHKEYSLDGIPKEGNRALKQFDNISFNSTPGNNKSGLYMLLKKINMRFRKMNCYNSTFAPIERKFKKIFPAGLLYNDVINYEFLIDGSNDEFIRRAYKVFLQREIDKEGYDYHIANLLRCKGDRVYEMGLIRYSKEGREKAVPVKGLYSRYKFKQLKNFLFRIPLVGYILHWITDILLLPRKLDMLLRSKYNLDYNLEVISNKNYRDLLASEEKLRQILQEYKIEINNEAQELKIKTEKEISNLNNDALNLTEKINSSISKIDENLIAVENLKREIYSEMAENFTSIAEVSKIMESRLESIESIKESTAESIEFMRSKSIKEIDKVSELLVSANHRSDALEQSMVDLRTESTKYATTYSQSLLVKFLLEEILNIRYNDPLANLKNNNHLQATGSSGVSIVYICDNNYALPASVSIFSACCNKKPETPYHFYVIGVELSDENIAMLESIGPSVTLITVDESKYKKYDFQHSFVSKAALYKFDIAEILHGLDKVLYLDSDMLVLDDLGKLFKTDITYLYAAVVKDMAAMVTEGHHIKMGHKNYFNSGMMLLNLKKMRYDGIPDKLMKNKLNDQWNWFMDQDIFNYTFSEQVGYVSPMYNYMYNNLLHFSHDSESISTFYEISKEELDKMENNPTILHLTNKVKPWNDICAQKYEQYKKYEILETVYRRMIDKTTLIDSGC